MNIDIIFISPVTDFYRRSGTRMGNFYTTRGARVDLSKIEKFVRDGHTMTIRTATPEEIQPYMDRLLRMENTDDAPAPAP